MPAAADEPLWSLGIAELTRGFAAGDFTPAEALGAVHERIDALNPKLNAVIAEDREAARAAAAAATLRWQAGAPLSPLDGVPVSIKDNLHAAGLPATWGSRAYADFRPAADEPPVERLRRAGAVVYGKTNVPEFTLQGYTDNLLFGPSFNPWAEGMTPGGSTGGGAAAVAAGFGPLAIGTDGGGSLRRPAAHCGLYALKPSIGQVARAGGFRQILADFEVVGPVCRSLADVRLSFSVLRGYDARDGRSLAALAPAMPFPGPVRVGFFTGIGDAPIALEVTKAAEGFAARLQSLGFAVDRIPAPIDPETMNACWAVIAQAGTAWEASHLGDRETLLGSNARQLAALGQRHSATAYLDALAQVAAIRSAAAALFSRFDLLLCPSAAALAWPAGEAFPTEIAGRAAGPRGHAIFTAWMNAAGLAALNVPVAMTADAGGIGMQLVAAPGRDMDLLDLLLAPGVGEAFPPSPSPMEVSPK